MSTDGYSSDEDIPKLPKTSIVSLGFVDTEIDEEPTIEDSFIGGQPVWFHPQSKPSDDLISCKNCTAPMALILQAFSPLEGSLYDRVIYVFGCKNAQCNRKPGSIRALRAVQKDPKRMKELELEQEKELKSQLDTKLKIGEDKNFLFGANDKVKNPFDGGDNPFSSNDNPFGGNPFDKKVETTQSKLDFASAAAKAAPKLKQKKSALGELPEYTGYFIYVDQETFQKKQAKKLPDNIKMSKDALDLETEGSASKEINPETQAVASGLQDEVFQRFSDIVEYNPLQVLRYDLGGSPLLFTSKDDVATKITKKLVPNPGYNPSSFRQFELQVMPKTIIDFEKNNIDINGGIEWGTIIVYTDKEDYVPILDQNHVGYVEEWVGVQWEEPIQKK